MTKQLLVDVPTQKMFLYADEAVIKTYNIATAANGVGEKNGSGQTPRGWHQIRAKIGHDCPINTVFVGRRPTGEIFDESLYQKYPDRDWILTRIFWLSGLEIGKNRLGDCDTMRRYIYIHGSPDAKPMGIPSSKGCINMHNVDLLDLFDCVEVGTRIFIRG